MRSAGEAAAVFHANGGPVIAEPSEIPVGHVAVVADPFGNVLVVVDLARGRYVMAADGTVIGVEP